MQEREFEKKVQEQMQGFDLEPSSEVWTNVERRIRKEKKRRFLAWWLVAGSLLIAGALYYGWPGRSGEPVQAVAAKPSAIPVAKTPVPAGSDVAMNEMRTNETVITDDKPGNMPQQKESNLSPSNNTTGATSNQLLVNEATIQSTKAKEKTVVRSTNKTKQPGTAPIKGKEVPSINITKQTNKVSDAVADSAVKSNIADVPVPINTIPDIYPAGKDDSATKAIVHTPVIKNSTVQDTVMQAKPAEAQKVKRKNKWETGVSLFAGKSNLGDGLVFSQNKSRFDAFNLGNGVTPPATQQYIIREPHSSASFGVGFFIKRKLSDKLNFNGELKYTYLSTRLLTGIKVDSTPFSAGGGNLTYTGGANNYYRPAPSAGGGTYFTNRYHYLHLSAGLSWKIIDGKKFKLYWDNSLGYGRLLGSNMLHYSGSLPGYYKDNNLLTKNQFYFSTGLTVPVFKRLELTASLAYAPSSLLKDKNGNNQHFTQFGIGLRYYLKK